MVRLYRKRDLASPLSEFLGAVVISIVLWFGGKLVFTRQPAGCGSIPYLYGDLFTGDQPAKTITQAYYNLQKGAASLDRIRQVLNEPEVIEEIPVLSPKRVSIPNSNTGM